MGLRIIFAVLLAIGSSKIAFAHKDTVIWLKGGKLEGLPPNYQPASFSFKNRRIAVGSVSVVIPECIWKRLGNIKEADLLFVASWYHDPSVVPPYIALFTGKAQGKSGYELLLNLDTLAVISFQQRTVEPDQTTYKDVLIEASCKSEWKVVRHP